MTQTTMHKTPEPIKASRPSIDDLINNIKVDTDDDVKVPLVSNDDDESDNDSPTENKESIISDDTKEPSSDSKPLTDDKPEDKQPKSLESDNKKEVKSDKDIDGNVNVDDYGNEIPKARTYTEEEVNRMMRERFNRSNYQQQVAPQPAPVYQQPTQQQINQASQGFTPDANSADTWEVQLNQYIDKRLEERERQIKTQQWQRQENEKQSEFQAKFNTGMEKYKDFRETVGKMPITDSMLLATRDLPDPAAFIYAAAKQYPEEVKRISTLPDAFQQAAEIGRLEERMRKSRNITKAAPPLRSTTSDVAERVEPKVNIDHQINSHAKRKARR